MREHSATYTITHTHANVDEYMRGISWSAIAPISYRSIPFLCLFFIGTHYRFTLFHNGVRVHCILFVRIYVISLSSRTTTKYCECCKTCACEGGGAPGGRACKTFLGIFQHFFSPEYCGGILGVLDTHFSASWNAECLHVCENNIKMLTYMKLIYNKNVSESFLNSRIRLGRLTRLRLVL